MSDDYYIELLARAIHVCTSHIARSSYEYEFEEPVLRKQHVRGR